MCQCVRVCVFEGVARPRSPPANLHITRNREVPNSWRHSVTFDFAGVSVQPVAANEMKQRSVCACVCRGGRSMCWSLEIIATHYRMDLDGCVLFIYFTSIRPDVLFPSCVPLDSLPSWFSLLLFLKSGMTAGVFPQLGPDSLSLTSYPANLFIF